MDEAKEKCGVVAVISKKGKPAAPVLYTSLLGVQHRGQDAAGFALYGDGSFYEKKGPGLVLDVLEESDIAQPQTMGIGHTRYPTTGTIRLSEIQPITKDGLCIAYNGHITNFGSLKDGWESSGRACGAECELVHGMLLFELQKGEGIRKAVSALMGKLDGAYSIVGIWKGEVFAFRDPHAIRPLVYGENEEHLVFCSESCALDSNGIGYGGSVGPGEIFIAGEGGKVERETPKNGGERNCMFEYVYFSRPDSTINGKLVERIRKKLGKQLFLEAPVEADVVVPVPDTSRSAALGYSEESGIRYSEGIIKNRYIGRTFIMPTQEAREKAVRMKVNPMKNVFAGKKVVLIDDSIVRGTTMREMMKMIRACNPKEVHLRITCPPIKCPCFYGVDIPTYSELIANKKSVEEIREYMGVDSLYYISLEGLKKVLGEGNCFGCLNGEYPTEAAREQAEKAKRS